MDRHHTNHHILFFNTVLYAHNMTDKYDENRIDAEKLRFLPKSVKSCIIEKRILCRYCMYSARTCSFRTSVCYAEVRSAMLGRLEVKGGEINSKKEKKTQQRLRHREKVCPAQFHCAINGNRPGWLDADMSSSQRKKRICIYGVTSLQVIGKRE